MGVSLKDNVFISFEDVVDWLKIDERVVGLSGGVFASLVVQDLTYTSKLYGEEGNDISIEYVSGGTAGSETVSVADKAISVTIEDGVSTADQIKAAIENSQDASALVSVSVSGTGSNAQSVFSKTNLSGGAYDSRYKARLVDTLKRLMNAACTKIETYIDCNVLARDYDEIYDGRGTNTIILNRYPVLSIEEVYVDYSRSFDASTKLEQDAFVLKYSYDHRATGEIRKLGNRLVLVGDDNNIIIGNIRFGYSDYSIRVKYRAGWGTDASKIPDDIAQAALMLCEYWYYKRENRDLGVKQKGTRGESYQVMSDGIPEDITDLLDPYRDLAMGLNTNNMR